MFYKRNMRTLPLFITIVVILSGFICLPAQSANNIILMIGDGMGSEHVKAGSYYLFGKSGQLCFEKHYKASLTTYSLDSKVTDSAAAATALATGHKVNNGVISQAADGSALETILEKAKSMGKRTGLVTTVPITHATPAGFGSHESSRGNLAAIGDDYLNSTRPNVIFGGGDPNKSSSYFSTAQIAKASSTGYQVVYDAPQLAALDPAKTDYALGLFAGDDMTYEFNRMPSCTEPHLDQMTTKALSILSAEPKGFFLMVEGGSIDHGAHANIIGVTAGEVAGFNKAVETVLKWMKGRKDTLLIVTADHETGGLKTTGKGNGQYPDVTWSTGGHTDTNVPFYTTGADSSLVSQYIKDGVMDNTDVNKFMQAAIAVPSKSKFKQPIGTECW